MKKIMNLIAVIAVTAFFACGFTRIYMIKTAAPSAPVEITWGDSVYNYD